MSLELEVVTELTHHRGVAVPAGVKFRQIIVTGPPASGKSTLIQQLGGWPEEGYLDLGEAGWWQHHTLTFRPREVHLGLPFVGYRESLAVTDSEWLRAPLRLDTPRLCIPPEKAGLFRTNWRRRYVFDFQLPPAEVLFETRRARARAGTHPVDQGITLRDVERQVSLYTTIALYFHQSGLPVFVRDTLGAPPKQIAAGARQDLPEASPVI